MNLEFWIAWLESATMLADSIALDDYDEARILWTSVDIVRDVIRNMKAELREGEGRTHD